MLRLMWPSKDILFKGSFCRYTHFHAKMEPFQSKPGSCYKSNWTFFQTKRMLFKLSWTHFKKSSIGFDKKNYCEKYYSPTAQALQKSGAELRCILLLHHSLVREFLTSSFRSMNKEKFLSCYDRERPEIRHGSSRF